MLPIAATALDAGQVETARRLYRRLLEVDDDSAAARMGLGDVAFQEQQPLVAARWYKSAIKRADNPEQRHSALLAHGRAALAAGQIDTAKKSFAKLAKAKDKDALRTDIAWGRNGVGLTLLLEGDLPGAVAEMERAAELAPEEERIESNLERARAALSDLPPAAEPSASNFSTVEASAAEAEAAPAQSMDPVPVVETQMPTAPASNVNAPDFDAGDAQQTEPESPEVQSAPVPADAANFDYGPAEEPAEPGEPTDGNAAEADNPLASPRPASEANGGGTGEPNSAEEVEWLDAPLGRETGTTDQPADTQDSSAAEADDVLEAASRAPAVTSYEADEPDMAEELDELDASLASADAPVDREHGTTDQPADTQDSSTAEADDALDTASHAPGLTSYGTDEADVAEEPDQLDASFAGADAPAREEKGTTAEPAITHDGSVDDSADDMDGTLETASHASDVAGEGIDVAGEPDRLGTGLVGTDENLQSGKTPDGGSNAADDPLEPPDGAAEFGSGAGEPESAEDIGWLDANLASADAPVDREHGTTNQPADTQDSSTAEADDALDTASHASDVAGEGIDVAGELDGLDGLDASLSSAGTPTSGNSNAANQPWDLSETLDGSEGRTDGFGEQPGNTAEPDSDEGTGSLVRTSASSRTMEAWPDEEDSPASVLQDGLPSGPSVEAIPTMDQPPPSEGILVVTEPAGIFLESGAFAEPANAEAVAGRLHALTGHSVTISDAPTANGLPSQSVRIGPILLRDTLPGIIDFLEAKGYQIVNTLPPPTGSSGLFIGPTNQPLQTWPIRHNGESFLQVGAYRKRTTAESLAAELRHLTTRAVNIVETDSDSEMLLYRVRIGPLRPDDPLIDLLHP